MYKGRLHSGEVVAIKVQRPGIGENIAVDMLLLRRLMGAVDRNIPQVPCHSHAGCIGLHRVATAMLGTRHLMGIVDPNILNVFWEGDTRCICL